MRSKVVNYGTISSCWLRNNVLRTNSVGVLQMHSAGDEIRVVIIKQHTGPPQH
jgi:hypothetical protein